MCFVNVNPLYEYCGIVIDSLSLLTIHALLKIKLYIYGESLAAAGCQRLALNLRPAMVTVK